MKSVQLGDVATSFVDGPFGSNLKTSDYVEAGVPILRIQNVRPNRFNSENVVYVSESKANELKRHDYAVGDLLITKLGEPCGIACTVPDEVLPGRIVADVTRFRGDPEKVDHNYVAYFLNSPLGRAAVRKLAKGTTRQRINLSSLKEIRIPLPPIEEQKRIAAILDQADSLRRLRQRAIDRLNTLGQAVFYEMFGDPSTQDSGCRTEMLSAVAELINGDRSSNYPSGDDLVDEGVPFLGTKNIRGSEIDLTECNFITEEKFSSLTRGILRRHDLVITLRGTLGHCAEFDCKYDTGFINAQMMIIRPSEYLMPAFLRAYISHPRTQAKLTQDRSGSAVPQLTAKQIGELVIPIPSIQDQKIFSDKLIAIRSLISFYNSHFQVLSKNFSSLQHRAFRGEL